MEPDRLGDLIDRLASPLALFARQWADNPEDVVQEAFLKLAEQPRAPTSVEAWLYRAVRNGAINSGIAARRRRRREAEASARAPSWFDTSRADPAIDPDLAESALAALPKASREVVVAHLWGRLTFDQIAEVVGTSASSAHRLYHAALETLRERLGVPCRPKVSKYPTPSKPRSAP